MILSIILVVAGLAALVGGGELLVRGATGLALKARLSPLVIGLVVVGFGTSMPELVTSVEAVLAGSPAIAWGNIAGSNIANSLLILGGAAIVAPIIIPPGRALRDPLVGCGAALMLFTLAATRMADLAIGLAMLAAMFVYLFYCLRSGRRHAQSADALGIETEEVPTGWVGPVLLTLLGLAVLIGGGQMLVSGAIDLAELVGMSETVIGLTVVAIGTSLPELVTAIVAVRKGESELAFGNVAGSNVYNILFIGGSTMTLAPGSLPADMLPVDLGVMVLSAFAILGFVVFSRHISRLAGFLLLTCYAGYLTFLVISA
ncbi:calcium/sodium antiporter [Altericroceibacterium endophyticum]|uniref:Calcium/sodium antiporter n=1 Tax=Altericroceibacterium endophyticum TaxID=1808508 RepID=A0A6I4T8M6_9SPHN|nr:calcium/sodium antiporter [Altericroceibacterium endophyticum]MXO67157.1 calcium/sodium antiporter [Altericroceibacterium endophyticum]